jgi:hypothetical protein
MDYCEELVRISNNLFDGNEKVLNLLSKLSNIGIIAGGSVVYALNSFVPKETVGDIDVFVNTKIDFWKCVELIYEKFPDCKFTIGSSHIVNHPTSIINVNIVETKSPPIQLILREFVSPKKLLKNFDIDYVQCGIHNNKLLITKFCKESHKERKILRVRPNIKEERLIKATRKNFKSIVFKIIEHTPFEFAKDPIDIESLRNSNLNFLKNSPYFGEETDKKMILTNTVYISTIEITKQENFNIEDLHDVPHDVELNHVWPPCKRFTTNTYLTFDNEDGLQETIGVSSFSYKITIKDICEETLRIFIEDDVFLSDNLLRYNYDMHDDVSSIAKRENILIIYPYYKNLKECNLRGIASFKNYPNSNMLPIEPNCNYDVVGHEFENRYSNIKSCKK